MNKEQAIDRLVKHLEWGWTEETAEAIKMGIHALEENKWIPCNERIPENDVEVLVWFEYFRYGAYNRPYQTIGISYVHRGIWSGFVNGESGWKNLRIIAWMPLPKLYKEKTE